MKIEGCVFDFGGVMTTTTMPERVRSLVSSLGIEWRILAVGFDRYRRLMDGGFMTLAEMYDKIWSDAGVELKDDIRARIVEEDQSSFLYRNIETLDFMKSLKERGFAIGILTNMCPEFVPLFKKHFADFIALADGMVISGEERMFKPMREIYDLLASRVGRDARSLCFFDDAEANCQGARDAGWEAIRFESAAQAAAEFEKLLLS